MKNRVILSKVGHKGSSGYETFKECLRATGQSNLVKALEDAEKEVEKEGYKREDSETESTRIYGKSTYIHYHGQL